MGLFEHFPYTNFHDLNLDVILNRVKTAETSAIEAAEDATQAAESAQALSGQIANANNTANSALSTAQQANTTAEEALAAAQQGATAEVLSDFFDDDRSTVRTTSHYAYRIGKEIYFNWIGFISATDRQISLYFNQKYKNFLAAEISPVLQRLSGTEGTQFTQIIGAVRPTYANGTLAGVHFSYLNSTGECCYNGHITLAENV